MLAIIYSGDDLLVVDKPAGMVVHPSAGHRGDTLLDALVDLLPPSEDHAPYLGLVHRLDRDTSGLLIVARTLQAHRYLSYQWRHRTVMKGYLALVCGHVQTSEGTIDLPLSRDPSERRRVIATPDGQTALTHYAVLRSLPGYSLLEVRPATGRMHQIRAHLAAIGHPIAGDNVYGGTCDLAGLTRPFLHAHYLVVRLPATRQVQDFCAPLPRELEDILQHVERR